MKFYNPLLILSLSILLIACNSSDNYTYSEKESEQFLEEIAKNAKTSIGDLTEINREATDELYILMRYPISPTALLDLEENKVVRINKDDDIWDFASYTFKSYELINEKNEKLEFVDNGRAVYLQEYALWDYDLILHQNLGIEIKLNNKYEKLQGYILIEFEMPDKVKKEVKIPVNITIQDEVAE